LKFKIFFLSTILLFNLFCSKSEKQSNYNLVLFTLDTTRADHIGSYGYKLSKTPNIDSLANNGLICEKAYTPVPLTLPSHTSILTGLYPFNHGVRNNGSYKLDDKYTTLAEILKSNGYQTIAVISSYVLSGKFGLKQGFDYYDDSLDSHKILNTLKSQISANIVYTKFKSLYKKINKNKRFFAWIHFYDPHTPYIKRKKFYNDKIKNEVIASYDSEIGYMDMYIGKILQDLKQDNLLDNTIIVFVGDHGEAFGEHKEIYSHMIFGYEENLRVPMIFYNKGLFKKSRIKNRVNTIDIFPTILSALKIKTNNKIDGINLLNKELKQESLYFESIYPKEEFNWAPVFGIISNNYKFIKLPDKELYDLESDKKEKNNLYFKKIKLANELEKKLNKILLNNKNSERIKLSQKDIKKLKSLGYISDSGSKSKKQIDPKTGIIYELKIKKVGKLIKKNKLTDALNILKELENDNFTNKIFFLNYYKYYKKTNDKENQIKILKRAITEFKDANNFKILLAGIYFEDGKIFETEELLKQVIKTNPLNTRAYLLYANIYYKFYRDKDKTIEYLKKALNLEPENILLNLKLAEIYLKFKRFKDAESIYDKLLKNNDVNNSDKLLYKIAIFKANIGKFDDSIKIFERIIELKENGKYYYIYSLILNKSGYQKQAIYYMKKALDFKNDLTPDEIEKAKAFIQ